MISAVILCMGLIGPGGGGCASFAAAAAAVPPSSGTPAPPASHRRDYDDDIPFTPGFFRFDRRPRKRGDRSSSGRAGGGARREGRREDVGGDVEDVAADDGRDCDASENDDGDDGGDDGEGPPLFFSGRDDGRNYDGDGQRRDRRESDRRHRAKGRRRGRWGHEGGRRRQLDPVRRWALERTGVRIPRVNVHFDPVTILKLRKSWPGVVPGAVVRVGADFETHRLGGGVWRLRGCLEDKLVGGRLTIREGRGRWRDDGGGRAVLVEYSKSWLFPGAGERVIHYWKTSGSLLQYSPPATCCDCALTRLQDPSALG
jgi:hypothetical protein